MNRILQFPAILTALALTLSAIYTAGFGVFDEAYLRAGTIALVIGRFDGRFSRAETSRLAAIESIVHAAMRRIWRDHDDTVSGQAATMHARLTQCFDNFGEGILTRREREITKLLLRGFSTKAIARHLDIAPGTVMVHKRNLFAKLDITSQYELFSRFIESLSL